MTARVLPPAWGLPAWTAMSTAIRRLSSISIRMTARRSGGCGSIPPACGVFNQQIHGSKRSLRSVEDFTEFEQRTAYFNGDPIHAMKKAFAPGSRAGLAYGPDAKHARLSAGPETDAAGTAGSRQGHRERTAWNRSSLGRGNAPPSRHRSTWITRCTISKSSVLSTKPP